MSETTTPPEEGTDSNVEVPAEAFDWIYDPNASIEADDEELEDVPQIAEGETHPDDNKEGAADEVADEAIDKEVREGLV